MGALTLIVTHQNVAHGPLLTEEALSAAMCAGTINAPGIDPAVHRLIDSIFVENTPGLILQAAAEIQADPATVDQLYRETVTNHHFRVPGWELAMLLVLPPSTTNPNAFKGMIHAHWLRIDPDILAAAVPVTSDGQVARRHIADCCRNVAPSVMEAFVAWYGVRTSSKPGSVYLGDWQAFLADLKRARAIAADPDFDMPEDGVVYRG